MKSTSRAARIYAATFIVAFASLAIEITLTRLLSVITFYGLVYFAVSTAMLGMTVGAITVYLYPRKFAGENLVASLTKACVAFALSAPLCVLLICAIPLNLDFSTIRVAEFIIDISTMKVLALLLITVACALPFYFSGIVMSTVLTKIELPINKLYASDLIGAAFGCVFVLAGLEFFDAPSLIIVAGALAVSAAFLFGWETIAPRQRKLLAALFAALILVALANRFTLNGIRPLMVKGTFENVGNVLWEKWNSHSRVSVFRGRQGPAQYWGPSPLAPAGRSFFQYKMTIDGEAGTVMRKFSRMADIEHLRYDVTNIAYFLRQGGSACIIGIGGGKDIQSAVLFGHKRITGLDVNPIFVDLLQGRFRYFAGIAGRAGVSLKVEEARSYLSRSRETFDIIQMSLIDTWAATAAGAYSLSENGLYTVEAWEMFLKRLNDDGMFTLSRWYSPTNLGETGRVVSLAAATLLDLGVPEPARNMAMVTSNRISTLILSRQPFSARDIATLKRSVSELQFTLAICPGEEPENAILRKIVSSRSREELTRNIAGEPLNYEPPTDENPYFFNMLKIGAIKKSIQLAGGVITGNLIASLTLVILILCLGALTILTIIVPLLSSPHKSGRQASKKGVFAAGAFYFSLIGFGFMFIEIALIQRLSVYLGHPVYALGILLFSMILSTGIGSLASQRLPLARKPWVYVYPLAAVLAIVLLRFSLSSIIAATITWGMLQKIMISIMVIFPTGLVLGMFFPTGMKLVRSEVAAETPWYWALNGICGVLGSATAVFISIYAGISINFYLAAGFYGLLMIATAVLHRAHPADA